MPAIVTGGRPGNRTTYRMTWQGDAVRRRVAENLLRDMESMAALLEGYLRGELHRWTGEMAERAYAVVEVRGAVITIRAGSDAEHTFYHEVRYHPQLRQTLDLWAPRLAGIIRAALQRSA